VSIRDASERDAEVCAVIYAPYVTDTVISFELEPHTAEEMAARIASTTARHAWLLLEDAEPVVGFAYGIPFLDRPAYWWPCPTSIHLEVDRRRTGGGRLRYTAYLAAWPSVATAALLLA
jgi:L-amino acid N-acyltransferase YncA